MSIETVKDAISTASVLYTGKDPHLVPKWQWWGEQLGLDRPLASINADDVDAGIQVLIETPASHYDKRGLRPTSKARAPATINRYIAALGTLYKLLKATRRLPRSFPVPSFKGLRLTESGGRTLQVTIQDVRRLVDAARLTRNPKLAALVATACTSGLRKGNLQALEWGQVNLKTRTLHIPSTKNGTATTSIVPSWVCLELQRIKPIDHSPEHPVFGRKDFRKAWETALDLAGLPPYTFHMCRHIAASVLAQSGCSLPLMMACLNHKSPAMSLRYAHCNTKSLDTAISNAWSSI